MRYYRARYYDPGTAVLKRRFFQTNRTAQRFDTDVSHVQINSPCIYMTGSTGGIILPDGSQQVVTTLDGASYSYDFAGNRTSKTNRLNNAASNFSYDNVYQLTGVTGPNPESYTYDPVGNRLTSQSVSNYAYNVSNQLTTAGSATYTYDDNGNTRTKTDGTGTTTYNWDFKNRLMSVQLPNSTTVTFKYDPFGRRIQKNSTNYVYDGASLVEEVDSSENLLAHYSQGATIDEPLSELRSGAITYYHQDGLGSVTSLSSVGGTLANLCLRFLRQSHQFQRHGGKSLPVHRARLRS